MSKEKHKKTKKHEYDDVVADSKHHFVNTHLEEDKEIRDDVDTKEVEKDEEGETIVRSHTPKKKRTQKEMKEKIETDLTAIYADSEGNIPDMHTFMKRKKSSAGKVVGFIVLASFFLAAIAWFGFTILQPQNEFSENDVVVSIDGEEEINAGEEVTYRIRYRNDQNVELKDALLEVRYPEAFQFVTSTITPTNEEHDAWSLGVIPRDAHGSIEIKGRLYGAKDSEHSLRAFLNYTPTNFNSAFQRVAQFTSKITGAPVQVAIEGPKEIRPGKEVAYKVTVKTDTQKGALPGDVRLTLTEGSDFHIKTTKPELQKEGNWIVDITKPEQVFELVGTFTPKAEAATTTLAFVLDAKQNNETFTLIDVAQEITLQKIDIKADLVVNGNTESISLAPGDTIQASLTIENVTEETLTDAQIQLSFDSPSSNKKSMLLWSKVDDVFDGDILGEQISETIRRGTITWTKTQIADLASLKPGAKVMVDVRLPVLSADGVDLTTYSTFDGNVSAAVKYKKGNALEVVTLDTIEFVINSDAKLDVRSEKSEDDVYKITWLLTNSFHNLENIKLEADLFGDISFDASAVSAPAGSIAYDDDSKKLVWNIQNMPTSVDTLALQFNVKLNKVNPSQKNLTSRVRGKAMDTATGKEIELVGEEVLVE